MLADWIIANIPVNNIRAPIGPLPVKCSKRTCRCGTSHRVHFILTHDYGHIAVAYKEENNSPAVCLLLNNSNM